MEQQHTAADPRILRRRRSTAGSAAIADYRRGARGSIVSDAAPWVATLFACFRSKWELRPSITPGGWQRSDEHRSRVRRFGPVGDDGRRCPDAVGCPETATGVGHAGYNPQQAGLGRLVDYSGMGVESGAGGADQHPVLRVDAASATP